MHQNARALYDNIEIYADKSRENEHTVLLLLQHNFILCVPMAVEVYGAWSEEL